MSASRESRQRDRDSGIWRGWKEAALVARLRAGDESAFAVLVEALHGRLLALARCFCSRPELAQEAVQET
jgi:DNA-directed RNA polymerase specialized sigma24 family protein